MGDARPDPDAYSAQKSNAIPNTKAANNAVFRQNSLYPMLLLIFPWILAGQTGCQIYEDAGAAERQKPVRVAFIFSSIVGHLFLSLA